MWCVIIKAKSGRLAGQPWADPAAVQVFIFVHLFLSSFTYMGLNWIKEITFNTMRLGVGWNDKYVFQGVVTETIRRVKASVPAIQRKMQLYLANRETEFILFRPIRCSSCKMQSSRREKMWWNLFLQVWHLNCLCHSAVGAESWIHIGGAGFESFLLLNSCSWPGDGWLPKSRAVSSYLGQRHGCHCCQVTSLLNSFWTCHCWSCRC